MYQAVASLLTGMESAVLPLGSRAAASPASARRHPSLTMLRPVCCRCFRCRAILLTSLVS
ncbi:hypothetical protein SVAN01_03700 [Stagonosporopsis vannaccii]|nr:hypothetical protein SVAN01_03700 [Stagonosporopsis vannaccii]